MTILDEVKFNSDGLVPAVAQDAETGEILMFAWMNRESLGATIATKRATYWSRSRRKLWIKGEESGNVQEVRSIHIDCDNDALVVKVRQIGGAACHTGHRSCFYREVNADGNGTTTHGAPLFDPSTVYKK